MTLSKGDKVYRVVELIHPVGTYQGDDWTVQVRIVDRASAKQIKLIGMFNGLARYVFDPNALGVLFFATAEEAMHDFARRQHRNIESAQRMVDEANSALAWTVKWHNANAERKGTGS